MHKRVNILKVILSSSQMILWGGIAYASATITTTLAFSPSIISSSSCYSRSSRESTFTQLMKRNDLYQVLQVGGGEKSGGGCMVARTSSSSSSLLLYDVTLRKLYNRRRLSPLYNVPPVPRAELTDPNEIKDSSNREPPPQSFYQLQLNSVRAAKLAMEDGHKLLEIEFPPLPANVMEMDDVSAYDVARANLNLALDFAKSISVGGGSDSMTKNSEESSSAAAAETGIEKRTKRVTIMLPDEAELDIALENLGGNPRPHPGVEVTSLRQSDPNDERIFKPEQLILNLFGSGSGGTVRPIKGTDVYIIIVASAQELPDVEELNELDPNAVIIMYNLKLDTLRGDLGAPAFPGKDFHDRFLSKVKPVYYLRTRQYNRSTPNPPFMVNYQGCLFRSYPGQYQTLLDTGDGKNYRRVSGNDIRPPLGTFKEQLTDALKVDGIIGDEGKALSFLRTGYKTTTWWEEEREDASDAWRT